MVECGFIYAEERRGHYYFGFYLIYGLYFAHNECRARATKQKREYNVRLQIVYIENTSDNTICYICIVKSFALWPYLVD